MGCLLYTSIVPAYTYSATALAVLHAGAKPVMVDSGTDFNISVEAVRKAITPKTKAIIPVDIAGFPCDYERIMALVQEPEMAVSYTHLFQVLSKEVVFLSFYPPLWLRYVQHYFQLLLYNYFPKTIMERCV